MSNPRPHLERLARIAARMKILTLEEAEARYRMPQCACGQPAVIVEGEKPYCAGCAPAQMSAP